MNIRVTTNEIRVRMTGQELVALISGSTLRETLDFANAALVFSVTPAPEGAPTQVEPGPGGLQVFAGIDDLRALTAAGLSKRGVERQIGAITLALQVDVRAKG